MKNVLILLGLLSTAAPTLGMDPPPVINTTGPAQESVTLDLQELWRAGGKDGEVLFGRISDVIRHPDGEISVLDNQLCQVEVFGPDGAHLRTLTRQGDGPGEVRQPIGLVLLPDDLVGVGAGFPGKMITMKRDGTPVATRYPIGEPSDGNIGVMISLNAAGDVLAATGGRIVFEGPANSHTDRFLAVSREDGEGFLHILERQTPIDPTGRFWNEAADYYFDSRWDLGPDGLIYVPLERDAYVVSVFDRTGRLQRSFGRDQKPRTRTERDKRQASPVINVTGGSNGGEWDICDHDPSITRIMVNPDDGTTWVLTPHGAYDQPDGILETWDVFQPSGAFLRQVAIPLGHAMREGTCHLVGDGLMIVVRGSGSSFNGDDDEAGAAEVEPLEVICYRIL